MRRGLSISNLILYGDCIISEPRLAVPHPRFRERAFVLGPLAEIAGDAVDPVTGLTMDRLWQRLQARAETGVSGCGARPSPAGGGSVSS